MGRHSLVDQVVDELLDDIVQGQLAPGGPLPAEADLAERFKVNRSTLREAVRKLQAQGVITPVPGRRAVIAPVREWRDLEAALRVTTAQIGDTQASIQLLQLRRMIETGSARLAATRIGPDQLAALERHWQGMQAASQERDVTAFVDHDMSFHHLIFEASGNHFLWFLLEPLQQLLRERRVETSRVDLVQEHAIRHHREVLDALACGDPAAAAAAMSAHMDQTERDLVEHVL